MLCSIIDLMTMNRLLSSPPHDNSSFLQYISTLDKNNYDRGFLGRYQRLEGISLPFQFQYHTEYLNQPAGGNGCLGVGGAPPHQLRGDHPSRTRHRPSCLSIFHPTVLSRNPSRYQQHGAIKWAPVAPQGLAGSQVSIPLASFGH